jgi:phosphohistidine swiveling domain-containing protein
MGTELILALNDRQASLDLVGGKGISLSRLAIAGFPVPGGFDITTNAYRLFVESNGLLAVILESIGNVVDASDPESLSIASQEITLLFENGVIPDEIIRAVKLAYQDLPGTFPAVAVRSSATAEDLPEASFAGQQTTILNVNSEEALIDAIRTCWSSLWTPRAISYRMRQGISPEQVALAVIVQLLVPAEVSGIMFTANPLTGDRDQILINASWGLGEAVVGGMVTPDTITVEKPTAKLLSYVTGEKLIQTVRVDGGTRDIPVPVDQRKKSVLEKTQALELANLGKEIEALYQMPMDIEWALAGSEFFILQARPITALPVPEPVNSDEWQLPDGVYAAMRNNIVELMADPLTPLFKTLGLGAVNRSMSNIMTGFLGNQDVMPGELILAVNEYAYYNGSVRLVPILKILLDTPGIMRRMFNGAVERWTEIGRPKYIQLVEYWSSSDWEGKTSTELLEAVDQLAEAAIDAYGSLVSGVIPAAWITEAWFSLTYKLIRGRQDPDAPTYLLGFDSLPIQAEKSLFDIAEWARENKSLADYLSRTPAEILAAALESDQAPDGVGEAVWQGWQSRFQEHLGKFGHMIYNLDFGNPVPADEPTPLIEALKLFLSGEGTNPYTRQAATAERREQAVEAMLNRLHGYRLKLFQKNLERAQRYAPLREDGLADVGLGYPLLRQMLAELGRRLTSAGLIHQAKDIYWLEEGEVARAAELFDHGEPLGDLSAVVPNRKSIWESAAKAAAPRMLPQLKLFGFDLLSLKEGRTRVKGADSLKGVGASPGRITAPASVLHGPEDFGKMETGNVLVASMTTPAWTPLFARAVAVVTDIGGPLSHGSIVAREYGIPAVLGTDSATKYIQDGQVITVDGDKGTVTLPRPV